MASSPQDAEPAEEPSPSAADEAVDLLKVHLFHAKGWKVSVKEP